MLNSNVILTAGPSITTKEIRYVNDAIRNGWNENWNYYITKSETLLKSLIGTKFVCLTSSCTGAMHMGLAALGIKKGDEVILPVNTWVASSAVVSYLKAKPVFVDVDPLTWNLNPEKVIKAITKKTKAIICVHLYGYPADMVSINQIANDYGLKVLEDAAPALGSTVENSFCGNLGDAGTFSFQGAKLVTSGEGGAFVTNDRNLYERFMILSEHGRSSKSRNPFEIETLGYKYKISNLQAACLAAQIERLPQLLKKKLWIHKKYHESLSPYSSFQFQSEYANTSSNYWMTSLLIKNTKFSVPQIRQSLLDKGVDTRPLFPLLSNFSYWKNSNLFPIASDLIKTGINLPSGHNLKKEQIEYIAKCLLDLVR